MKPTIIEVFRLDWDRGFVRHQDHEKVRVFRRNYWLQDGEVSQEEAIGRAVVLLMRDIEEGRGHE